MRKNNFYAAMEAVVKKPDNTTIANFVDIIEQFPPSDEEIAELAFCLSRSGSTIGELKGINSADIPSTGGPSSLSTILCPLYLRAFGYVVPKLGIPGRPAGGIDVMAQIPGYKIDFSTDEIRRLLHKSGYVHFLASRTYVPLDAKIFSYRKQFGKINIPELAISSLLSKKLAVSVSLVGLDVRIAQHGNFGTSYEVAEINSKRLCRIAKLVGIRAVCLLSNADKPYQPFIGRGEALVALYNIITNQADPWLKQHDVACYAMAKRLVEIDDKACYQLIYPICDDLREVLANNLDAQGSSFEKFINYALMIRDSHKNEIRSHKKGFFCFDINSLRTLLVDLQKKYISKNNQFPDPCGIILKRRPGEYVSKGDVIATFRCDGAIYDIMLAGLKSAISMTSEPNYDNYFSVVQYNK